MARLVVGTFRLRGRASRSEYWWWMLVNVVVLASTQFLIPASPSPVRGSCSGLQAWDGFCAMSSGVSSRGSSAKR
ncbi:DUF805 domain-containing protein [Agromyces cavernae]|uniref:DUF805 domain-containing protein n=1 Tax=Agromyces cavernae TaxID=2898659 RepID=UPI003558739C